MGVGLRRGAGRGARGDGRGEGGAAPGGKGVGGAWTLRRSAAFALVSRRASSSSSARGRPLRSSARSAAGPRGEMCLGGAPSRLLMQTLRSAHFLSIWDDLDGVFIDT